MTAERIKRFLFGFLVFLVVLFAVTLLIQAVEDTPDEEVRTVTS